jgi:hypothetical protein
MRTGETAAARWHCGLTQSDDPPEEITMSTIDISTRRLSDTSNARLDDTDRAELQAFALGAWRAAESHVQTSWDAFLAADLPSRRRAAFAVYVGALDAEEAAADALALVGVEPAMAA